VLEGERPAVGRDGVVPLGNLPRLDLLVAVPGVLHVGVLRAVVAEQLQVGQISSPIRTDAGLHLIAVCGKRSSSADLMNRDQIENRLYGQQLAMIAKRYLRDLRNSATIETR